MKTQWCYLRKRKGVLCVDVVAKCDRYVGERWERCVCTGKEGGPGGVRGVECRCNGWVYAVFAHVVAQAFAKRPVCAGCAG